MKCLDLLAMRQIMTPLNYMHKPSESRRKVGNKELLLLAMGLRHNMVATSQFALLPQIE